MSLTVISDGLGQSAGVRSIRQSAQNGQFSVLLAIMKAHADGIDVLRRGDADPRCVLSARRCLGRRGLPQRGLVNVRFVREATELLRCREASLCATIRQLDSNPSYAKEQAATLPLAGEHPKKKQKMPFVAAFQRATRRPHR